MNYWFPERTWLAAMLQLLCSPPGCERCDGVFCICCHEPTRSRQVRIVTKRTLILSRHLEISRSNTAWVLSSGITWLCWPCPCPFSSFPICWHGGPVASASYWRTAWTWPCAFPTACSTYTATSGLVSGNLCEAFYLPRSYWWCLLSARSQQHFPRYHRKGFIL